MDEIEPGMVIISTRDELIQRGMVYERALLEIRKIISEPSPMGEGSKLVAIGAILNVAGLPEKRRA